MPELRKDPIIGRWVIIATERAARPMDFAKEKDPVALNNNCPFCEGQEKKTPPEILAYHPPGRAKDSPDWWIRVVSNKFPALGVEGDLDRRGDGIYDRMNGVGAHEVIIECPDHDKKYFELAPIHAGDMLWSFRERILDLKKDPRMEYILIFKNHGKAAGASLAHPHAQLIALPMVPAHVKQEISGGRQYIDFKERCIFCDIVSQELSAKSRIVDENEDFLCFAPYASRFPFETWIIPKHHQSHFETTERPQIDRMASLLQSTLSRMDSVLGNPPFNYILHSAPLKEPPMAHFHWHLEIIPKLTHVAGFEWGSGFYINPMPPEQAAKYLREANLSSIKEPAHAN